MERMTKEEYEAYKKRKGGHIVSKGPVEMPNPCDNCDKYFKCTELCEKVEAYANQDYVSQEGAVFTPSELPAIPWEPPRHWTGKLKIEDIIGNAFNVDELTREEIIMVTLLGLNLRQSEVAKLMKIRPGTFRQRFSRFRKEHGM